ncbi:hypothetical protein ONE63_009753 [Megalurothrips usitatus]|uniref:Uncharacterized protein n=1 Tax=Megalurothrips usitatus TaxID=439358 RepID=A0AAV7XKB5_9NEOP|nr:hypothetical protein ONE63_009753 [Megalurothrips usitatus]
MEHWIQEWANSTIWSELCWSSSPTSSPQSLGCCAFSDFHLMGSLSGLPWLISLMSAEWTSFRVPAVCTQHRQSFLPCEHCPWQSLGVDLRRMNPQFA